MRWVLCAPLLIIVLSLTSCRSKPRPQLTLFTWAGYLDQEVIDTFEAKHECRVRIDTFDSNESMYAKLQAGQREGYDIVFPSSYMAALMQEQGWLTPLEHSRLPHLHHLDQKFLNISIDPRCTYSVPFMITLTGLGYLNDRWNPGEEPSWGIFGKSWFQSRMTLLNDMRETIGAALLFCGLDPNSTDARDLNQAESVLHQWRKNIAKFENEQYKMGLASAEFIISHGYFGDILQTQRENPKVGFTLAKEGSVASCDDLVILTTSRHPELAHAFINHLLDPGMAAKSAQYCQFLSPNAGCLTLLDSETALLHRHYLSSKTLSKAHFIRDLKEQNAAYIKVWDRVKSGDESQIESQAEPR